MYQAETKSQCLNGNTIRFLKLPKSQRILQSINLAFDDIWFGESKQSQDKSDFKYKFMHVHFGN